MSLGRIFKRSTRRQALRKERIADQLKKLFDREWFIEEHGSTVPDGVDPFEYYRLRLQVSELAPNVFFDPVWYRENSGGVDMESYSAVEHYIVHGDGMGLNPGPLFQTKFFREMNPHIPSGDTALAYFMTVVKTAFPNPLFDSTWYAARYDVKDTIPLKHFILTGWKQDMDPSPMFSTAYYRFAYPDVVAAGLNPLADYLNGGDRKGRDPSPYFDSDWYLSTYPDIAASTMNALAHYLQYGYNEGRRPSASQ